MSYESSFCAARRIYMKSPNAPRLAAVIYAESEQLDTPYDGIINYRDFKF